MKHNLNNGPKAVPKCSKDRETQNTIWSEDEFGSDVHVTMKSLLNFREGTALASK